MIALSSVFRDKLITWAEQDLEQRLVVARPVMAKTSVPYGVELSRKKISGKRVLVRTRDEGPQKIVRARWPESQLHELYVPKLMCVLRGQTDYRAGEYIVTCDEGYFVLLPPGTPNAMGGRSHLEGENRKRGSCELLQIIITRDYIRCLTSFSRGEEHGNEEEYTSFHPHVIYLLQLFVEEALRTPRDNKMIGDLFAAAAGFMRRELEEGGVPIRSFVRPDDKSKSTFRDDDMLQHIHIYIKTHLKEPLSIERVARAMYMSSSQLTRYVRRKADKSFVDILSEHRLEEAKRLLQETEWSTAAIARQIGFRSLPYFTAFFTRNEGCSPGKYRAEKASIK